MEKERPELSWEEREKRSEERLKKQLVEIDLAPLSACKYLEEVNLKNNRLTEIDLSPLVDCSALRRVDIRDNPLENIDTSMIPKANIRIIYNRPFEEIKLKWDTI
ncbi:MAG: hypothetical protein GF309_02290 [Candidatus Lokiarchaeota archaeon]|nr:hypothetical protein [Candidatus Lokiarchaeota archaeon]